MRIFLDANILVSVVNKEYPLFTYSSRILSLVDSDYFEVYTSPICLAITFYFASKKHGAKVAKQKIALLSKHIRIASTTNSCVQNAAENKSIEDFEDGLEYYSALESGCNCIITEDVGDFYFSDIDVMKSEDFLIKHQNSLKGRFK